MKKIRILLLFISISVISCNKTNDFVKVFNHFIVTQSKLETKNYPGVKQILEIHQFDSLTIYEKKDFIFFKMFDPRIKYRAKFDEDGNIQEYGNYEGYLFRVRYLYNKNGQIQSISGYLPYPVNYIIEYDKNSAIESIYREGQENNLFKYSNDFQSIMCYSFQLGSINEGKAIKLGELLRKYSIKNVDNENFVITETDAKTDSLMNEFKYSKLKLVKQKSGNGLTIDYEYDKYENIIKMIVQIPGRQAENYTFAYQLDEKQNWINRKILLNGVQILSTERKITYY